MEPRFIEATAIRIGDTVRAEANTTTVEGRVTSFDGFKIVIGSIVRLERGVWSWTLLDRPEPPRKVGSRWRDPETSVSYILTDFINADASVYFPYSGVSRSSSICAAWSDRDAEIIARLVPLDGDS